MHRVLVAVGAKLVKFQSVCGRPTVFGCRVARNAGRAFIRVRSALCALQRNNDAIALSHISILVWRR
jgi:hypothetical protein